MSSKPYLLIFLYMLCSAAFLTGCATTTTDNLPSDVTKGYVEFYKADTTGKGAQAYQIRIYQLQDGKEIHIGNTGEWTDATKRRIACRPGQQTFIAKLGNAEKRIRVQVYQDKITPVRITVRPLGISYSSYYPRGKGPATHYFDMSLDADEPVPIKN